MTPVGNDSRLGALAERIAEVTGLSFPSERQPELLRALEKSAPDLGLKDGSSAIDALLTGPPARERIEILARRLTVGETYFFRGPRFLDAFQNCILPMALRMHASDRRLRIWSAGCASGEEPYTIAMLLKAAVIDRGTWDISIDATDINAELVKKASIGVYGEWSFRMCPAHVRKEYFQQAGKGHWRIRADVRRMVDFSCHNLVQDPFPRPMDIIICKNVLMYFTQPAARKVIKGFRQSMNDVGWLLVSPAESFLPVDSGFSLVTPSNTVAFTNRLVAAPVSEPEPDAQQDDNESPGARLPKAGLEDAVPSDPGAAIRRARACADGGQLDEALQWCRKAVALDVTDAESHFLMATILSEQGLLEEAAYSLRTTLFLQPNCVPGHIAQGNLARKRGRQQEASRHFRNALSLLLQRAPGDVIPDTDGMTAARLRGVIMSCMKVVQ